jgi:hypothetical protein
MISAVDKDSINDDKASCFVALKQGSKLQSAATDDQVAHSN